MLFFHLGQVGANLTLLQIIIVNISVSHHQIKLMWCWTKGWSLTEIARIAIHILKLLRAFKIYFPFNLRYYTLHLIYNDSISSNTELTTITYLHLIYMKIIHFFHIFYGFRTVGMISGKKYYMVLWREAMYVFVLNGSNKPIFAHLIMRNKFHETLQQYEKFWRRMYRKKNVFFFFFFFFFFSITTCILLDKKYWLF